MKPVRYAVALIAFGVLAGCVVLTLDRLFAPGGRLWVLLVSFTSYGVLGYAVALALLLLVRVGAGPRLRRPTGIAALVAALGLALHVAWVAPLYVGTHPSGRADLTILDLNMEFGRADPAAVVRLAGRVGADLVVLEEATPSAVAAVQQAAGPKTPWPHRGGLPMDRVSGTVVLSSFPVKEERRLPIWTGAHRIRVQAPVPFTLTAAHTTQPFDNVANWHRDFDVLRADTAAVSGPRLLVGDFNATLDHGPMRKLLGLGLTDAAVDANSGWQPTWPVPHSRDGKRLDSPFTTVAIDHVLMSDDFSAISTRTYRVPGTDHLALVARLARR